MVTLHPTAAFNSPSCWQVIRKALQHLDLPDDVKATAQKRARLVHQIQKALEVHYLTQMPLIVFESFYSGSLSCGAS